MSRKYMGCEHYHISFPDYVHGLLDESERSLVEQHLSGCLDCRLDVRGLKKLGEVLDSQTMSLPPNHYFTNLLPRIRSRMTSRVTPRLVSLIFKSRWVLPLFTMVLMVSYFMSAPSLVDMMTEHEPRFSDSRNNWREADLLDLADRQIETLTLSLQIDRQENLAYSISRQLITDQLADAVFSGNVFVETVPFSSSLSRDVLQDMNDEEVEMLIQRLSERTIL